MKNKLKINIIDLLLCFSDALDLVSPLISSHQVRVAYIALKIAKQYKLPKEVIDRIVIASCIHDIGATTIQERNKLIKLDFETDGRHEIIGWKYLENSKFDYVADIVKYHHLKWNKGKEMEGIPLESYIIHLADRVDVAIKRDGYILEQRDNIIKYITAGSGSWFMPELVDAFLEVSKNESFWLYIASNNLEDILSKEAKLPKMYLDIDELYDVTKWFSNIIDFRSRFTSVHSRGVSASAAAIATVMNLDKDEIKLIEIAGFIHDLGKLAVPNTILEKNGKLDKEEYNIIKSHTFHTYNILSRIKSMNKINEYGSYHHEKLDGTGYPFHIKARQMKLGSRILAVADMFTAIAEDRPYRLAMEKDQIIGLIAPRGDNKVFDSKVVKAFLDNYEFIDAKRKQAQAKAKEEYESFWI